MSVLLSQYKWLKKQANGLSSSPSVVHRDPPGASRGSKQNAKNKTIYYPWIKWGPLLVKEKASCHTDPVSVARSYLKQKGTNAEEETGSRWLKRMLDSLQTRKEHWIWLTSVWSRAPPSLFSLHPKIKQSHLVMLPMSLGAIWQLLA